MQISDVLKSTLGFIQYKPIGFLTHGLSVKLEVSMLGMNPESNLLLGKSWQLQSACIRKVCTLCFITNQVMPNEAIVAYMLGITRP